MKHIFIDETQKNEQRLRRARILQQSKKLDGMLHWITIIAVIVAYPALYHGFYGIVLFCISIYVFFLITIFLKELKYEKDKL